MKRLLLFSLFCLLTSPVLWGQKVVYKDDIIYVDDVAYAQMTKRGGIVPDFSVSTLDGTEFMMVKFDKGEGGTMQYIATFIGSGMQAFLKNDIGFGKKLAREVVENNLVSNGHFNPEGERRFLLSHSGTPNSQSERTPAARNSMSNNTDAGRTMPKERDRNQGIFLRGQNIMQANIIIGSYQRNVITINGELYNMFYFYTPDGAKVAEAKVRQFNAGSCKLTTVSDNKITSVGIDSDIEYDQVKQISAYLSDHLYF
jgi:hypothetical protein